MIVIFFSRDMLKNKFGPNKPTMPAKQKVIAEEYSAALVDLNINSKPLINMLTMLAEENSDHAPIIVHCIEQQLLKV